MFVCLMDDSFALWLLFTIHCYALLNHEFAHLVFYDDPSQRSCIKPFFPRRPGWIATRYSKTFFYIKDDDKGGKTAKVILKNVIKKYVKHEDYKKFFFWITNKYIKMKTIRSNNHQLGSYELNKASLSCFDDKRYILDGI